MTDEGTEKVTTDSHQSTVGGGDTAAVENTPLVSSVSHATAETPLPPTPAVPQAQPVAGKPKRAKRGSGKRPYKTLNVRPEHFEILKKYGKTLKPALRPAQVVIKYAESLETPQ